MTYELHPIGFVRSPLTDREAAPRQGSEGAPDAWIELEPSVLDALERIEAGYEVAEAAGQVVVRAYGLDDSVEAHPLARDHFAHVRSVLERPKV